jgi:hypothetical protein
MAYGIKKIAIADMKPSMGVGVKIPFSEKSVFTTVYSTKEQLKFNLINYLLSDPRERPFNVSFGAGLRSKIFEHISYKTIEDIKMSLTTKLEKTFPQINISDVIIDPNADMGSIMINFSYSIVNTGENDEVNIQIQK